MVALHPSFQSGRSAPWLFNRRFSEGASHLEISQASRVNQCMRASLNLIKLTWAKFKLDRLSCTIEISKLENYFCMLFLSKLGVFVFFAVKYFLAYLKITWKILFSADCFSIGCRQVSNLNFGEFSSLKSKNSVSYE